MDRFVKRYMVPKTDQYGNVVYKDGEKVMVQSMISRRNVLWLVYHGFSLL